MQSARQEACKSPRSDRSDRGEYIDRVVALLDQALEIIDSSGEFPELGAKLNDVIEELREERHGG